MNSDLVERNPIVLELFDLSDNASLFERLRSRGGLEGMPKTPSSSRTRRGDMLAQIQTALLPVLTEGEFLALDALIEQSSLNDQVLIAGECILTLFATADRNHIQFAEQLRHRIFELIDESSQSVEVAVKSDQDDQESQIHAEALREWAHLLAEQFGMLGLEEHRAQMLVVRARVTNAALTRLPHLVGDAMVTAGRAIEKIGQTEMPAQIYNGVRLDLRYCAERIDDPDLPGYEKHAAVYWLEQACAEYVRLHPGDLNSQIELQTVRRLREERGLPDIPSAPRFGPIARTYLGRIPWLAQVIRALQADIDGEMFLASICQRYGCSSRDVEFYQSALGSYFGARPMLESLVTLQYGDAHEEVFTAIEYGQEHACESD